MLPNDAVGVSSWRAIEMSYDRGAIRRPGVFLLFIYLDRAEPESRSICKRYRQGLHAFE